MTTRTRGVLIPGAPPLLSPPPHLPPLPSTLALAASPFLSSPLFSSSFLSSVFSSYFLSPLFSYIFPLLSSPTSFLSFLLLFSPLLRQLPCITIFTLLLCCVLLSFFSSVPTTLSHLSHLSSCLLPHLPRVCVSMCPISLVSSRVLPSLSGPLCPASFSLPRTFPLLPWLPYFDVFAWPPLFCSPVISLTCPLVTRPYFSWIFFTCNFPHLFFCYPTLLFLAFFFLPFLY